MYDVSASKIRWRAMQPLGTGCVKEWIPGITCTTEDSKYFNMAKNLRDIFYA